MAIPVYLWLKDGGGTYKDGNIIHSDSRKEHATA